MKAFLILEDGNVFTGTSIGSTREVISEIVFNTSMTGYLEVLTDPSYAGQAVVMTYPLIGNYGITPDMESGRPWPDGYIVRELSRMPSNFRCEGTIQDFLAKYDIPGIAGIDTRALTKILREKGTMNGMITTNENYNIEEIIPKLKAYTTGNVVDKVTCTEKRVLKKQGNAPETKKVALLDLGAKRNIAQSLRERGCEVTVYPAHTSAEEILAANPDGIMLSNGPGDPKECKEIIAEIRKLYESDTPIFAICLGHQLMALATGADTHKMKYGHRGGNHQGSGDEPRLHFFTESRLRGRHRYPGSEGGNTGVRQCQRRNERGTFLCRQEHFHGAVPSGSVSGTAGFSISV